MYFQIANGGTHESEGKTYRKGDVIKTDTDLVAVFPNRFTKVSSLKGVPTVATVEEDEEDTGSEAENTDEAEGAPVKPSNASEGKAQGKPVAGKKKGTGKPDVAAAGARGTEVTDSFVAVAKEGFEIFKRDGFYHVYEPGETKPLNKTGLKKDAVEAFVKKQLEE